MLSYLQIIQQDTYQEYIDGLDVKLDNKFDNNINLNNEINDIIALASSDAIVLVFLLQRI